MKKLLSILLSTIFVFSLCCINVNAEEQPDQKEIVAILQLNGEIYYFDQDELDEFKQQNDAVNPFPEFSSVLSENTDESILRSAGSWTAITNKVFGTPFLNYNKKTKVTPSIKGAATITQGSSATFSFTANVSLSATDKSSIGGSWTASSNSSFSVSFQVPANRVGYVQFTPYYRPVTADKIYYVDGVIVNTVRLNITQPVKVGAYADGLYELKLQ